MKTWVHIVVSLLVCALWGCGSSRQTDGPGGERPEKVRLSIRVATTEVATRGDGSEAATDDEKMRTLRILIVRPDGRVEANRFLRLTEALMAYGYETFEVESNQTKRVYLLANEENSALKGSERFVALRPGDPFPEEEIAALMLELEPGSAQIAGPLPMSECHEVEVASEDRDVELFVTRAAVKFTFRLINRSNRERQLTGLAIEKTAPRAYYLPRDVRYNEQREITGFTVPAGDVYYRFDLGTIGADRPQALPTGDEGVVLDPIYLLEGKHTDPAAPAGKSPYRIALSLDGSADLLTGYLDNLPALPRNTHAVVTVTIHAASLACTVDVVPYRGVDLEPDFGI